MHIQINVMNWQAVVARINTHGRGHTASYVSLAWMHAAPAGACLVCTCSAELLLLEVRTEFTACCSSGKLRAAFTSGVLL